MRSQAGTTIVELLVASGIMLAASAAIFTLTADGLRDSGRWNDAADVHQRARVAADAIVRHVSNAASGVPTTEIEFGFPPVEPRRRSSFLLSETALTVRHVPENAAWTRVTSDVAPGLNVVTLDIHPGCPAGLLACGFAAATDGAILDGRGGWHAVRIEPSGPAEVVLSDRIPGRTATYPADSTLVEVSEASLYFDSATRTLRQEGPGDGDFPVVDGIESASFAYFDTAARPLPLSTLTDGPLCGSGSLAYDCDLQRIQMVRAAVRVASPGPGVRGLDFVIDVAVRRRAR